MHGALGFVVGAAEAVQFFGDGAVSAGRVQVVAVVGVGAHVEGLLEAWGDKGFRTPTYFLAQLILQYGIVKSDELTQLLLQFHLLSLLLHPLLLLGHPLLVVAAVAAVGAQAAAQRPGEHPPRHPAEDAAHAGQVEERERDAQHGVAHRHRLPQGRPGGDAAVTCKGIQR